MRASTVRTCAAAAAVPAIVVVVAHLAYVWQQHPSAADRQSTAFSHGVGLAAILAAVLAAGRLAQWLEGGSRRLWPGVIGIVASIAVLAHLADDWRAGSAAVRSVHILLVHLALLLAIAFGAFLAGRLEDAARAQPPATSR
jgi:protein-S-isoprenylcysteine O-methyltransferase Ste14